MKINRTSLISFLLLIGSLVGGKLSAEESSVIGSIGKIELTETDVLASLGNLETSDKEALFQDASTLNKLVRSLLVQRVVLQQALEKEWDKDSSTVSLLKNTREAAIADSYLKSICKPPESFPSESELRAAYEANREALTVPRSFRLAQIYVSDPGGTDKKAKTRLEAAQKRLRANGADFGQIARELSEEKESASRDGEIGWLKEQQIQPEILAQLPKLNLNVLSDPVRLKDGWHILKVLDAREPFTPIFDQVRVQLSQRLRAEKTRANTQSYVSELLQKHPVAINEVALSKMLRKTSPGGANNP